MGLPIPIRNHFIFQFESKRTKHMGVNQFQEETDWGFEFVRVDDTTQSARWVTVLAVGPECDPNVQPGMRVLLDKLMWSEAFEVDGEEYWRSDSDQVLLIDEDTIPA